MRANDCSLARITLWMIDQYKVIHQILFMVKERYPLQKILYHDPIFPSNNITHLTPFLLKYQEEHIKAKYKKDGPHLRVIPKICDHTWSHLSPQTIHKITRGVRILESIRESHFHQGEVDWSPVDLPPLKEVIA